MPSQHEIIIMFEWMKSSIADLGYPAIAFFMFLENAIPPIPSEFIMPLGGFLTEQEELSFVGIVIAGTIGSVAGTLPLYYLGRFIREERLKHWIAKYGKWIAISEMDVERAMDWFDRHGGKAVLICRLIPGLRSLISIPAGAARMDMTRFLCYTVMGTGLWTSILAYAGVLLGENYEKVETYLGPISYLVLLLIFLPVIYSLVRRGFGRD